MYESIRQPFNTYRRELPSVYLSDSLPQAIRNYKNEMEVDSLSDILVNSLSLSMRKKIWDFNANLFNCKCTNLKITIISY